MKAGNRLKGKTKRTSYLVMMGYGYPKESIFAKGRGKTKVYRFCSLSVKQTKIIEAEMLRRTILPGWPTAGFIVCVKQSNLCSKEVLPKARESYEIGEETVICREGNNRNTAKEVHDEKVV
jgi:hypothetical protein